MSEDEAPLPRPNVPFAVSELLAITSVISGYVAYLQSCPPSPDGERRITILAEVRDRFQAEFASGNPQMQVPLNAEEVTELLEAMIGFVGQINKRKPHVTASLWGGMMQFIALCWLHKNCINF